ncbi:Ankyrin repeat domain-containing protein 13D, partial [Spheniscus magellanicus]
RNKSGIWGWRSEKMEVVSGYEAKVYSASNVELVTKTRTEHLSDQDKSRSKGSKTPFHSFLGIAQQHGTHNGAPVLQAASPTNPTAITPEEYFDPHFDLETRNIGRPIEMSSKVQRFKATLWLCEQHPLSLAEQVTPIIDLMAISNAHFAKLRDFITLKLPPGFPVKIEIPLFHVLNARITFSNLCGCDQPLGSVRVCAPAHPPSTQLPSTQPPGPRGEAGGGRGALGVLVAGGLLWDGEYPGAGGLQGALTNTRPGADPPPYDEDLQLERADSPAAGSPPGAGGGSPPVPPSYGSFAEQLRLAMALSEREQEERERRQREEDEELQRILRLSLTDK